MTAAVAPLGNCSGASPGGAKAMQAAATMPMGNGRAINLAAMRRNPERPMPTEHEMLHRFAWSRIDRLKDA